MKTAYVLVVSTVALMITLSALLARGNPENRDATAPLTAPATAYAIGRPGDAAASCNALIAEIDQIATEVHLRSIAQANAARSLVANRRSLHLTTLLKQQRCIPSQVVAST